MMLVMKVYEMMYSTQSLNLKSLYFPKIHAEVVTFVAESLEAGGLPGYPEVVVSLK